MEKLSNYCNSKQRGKDVSSTFVKAVLKINASQIVKSLELIKTGSGDCGSNTRVTARAFASTDHAAVTNSHAAHLIGVHGAAVIATRRLSGKSMDLLAGNAVNYVHRVAGIDLLHFMPANPKALQGINNQQSLIKEDDFGMNENQVKEGAYHQTPSKGAEGVSNTVINDIYVNQGADSKEGAESHYVTTTWSEGFQVGHPVILSCKERRAA